MDPKPNSLIPGGSIVSQGSREGRVGPNVTDLPHSFVQDQLFILCEETPRIWTIPHPFRKEAASFKTWAIKPSLGEVAKWELTNTEPDYFRVGKPADASNRFFQSYVIGKAPIFKQGREMSQREDQERLSLFNPGLIPLQGEGAHGGYWFITPFHGIWHPCLKAIHFSSFLKLPQILLPKGSLKEHVLPSYRL